MAWSAVNAIRAGYLGVRAANRFGQVERALLRLGQIAARGGNTVLRFLGVKNGSQVSKWVSTVGQFVLCDVLGLACFTAGTPVECEGGSKPIEQMAVGDMVWSRDEDNPEGPVELKRVEELFRRSARILTVRAGGCEIGTTDEHPFFVVSKGWVEARLPEPGDRLVGRDGTQTAVEGVHDTGEWAVVYNFRVADWHTFFLGGDELGVSLWTHNMDLCVFRNIAIARGIPAGHRLLTKVDHLIVLRSELQRFRSLLRALPSNAPRFRRADYRQKIVTFRDILREDILSLKRELTAYNATARRVPTFPRYPSLNANGLRNIFRG